MKKALMVAFVVLLLAALLPVAQADPYRSAARGIVGNWLSVVHRPDGAPRIQFLHTFNADGVTTLVLPFGPDATLPEPPDPPTVNLNDSRVACTGEWRHVWHRTYDVTMYCLARQNPGVEPDVIRLRLTLDKTGTYLSGPFKYKWMDPVFGPPGGELSFVLKSRRLGIVPLD